MRIFKTLVSLGLLGLAACEGIYPPTTTPDYTIRVMHTSNGDVALPPNCPSWTTDQSNPYDNQPMPQFGCAHARNLALQVENPQDIVKGRTLGPAGGTMLAGTIRRYDNSQTRGLIDPSTAPDSAVAVTTSSAASSSLTGDLSGFTGQTSGTPSSSSTSAASASPGGSVSVSAP
jgi:hypothetical protein